ncbi:MAG TPA: hypothetical protein VLE27_00790 [Thermoanaerobaculia bacterium]|nr:hypothetical protein [Thermoanaerobaculia bacterium]
MDLSTSSGPAPPEEHGPQLQAGESRLVAQLHRLEFPLDVPQEPLGAVEVAQAG